jgi:hypothetical protein
LAIHPHSANLAHFAGHNIPRAEGHAVSGALATGQQLGQGFDSELKGHLKKLEKIKFQAVAVWI